MLLRGHVHSSQQWHLHETWQYSLATENQMAVLETAGGHRMLCVPEPVHLWKNVYKSSALLSPKIRQECLSNIMSIPLMGHHKKILTIQRLSSIGILLLNHGHKTLINTGTAGVIIWRHLSFCENSSMADYNAVPDNFQIPFQLPIIRATLHVMQEYEKFHCFMTNAYFIRSFYKQPAL